MSMGYVYVAATLVLTVYGQIVVKRQVDAEGELPGPLRGKLDYVGALLTDPWIWSVGVAGGVAAVTYMLALAHLELSRAYPVMALSFALVLVASAVGFGESLTAGKVVGVGLILIGVLFCTQV